MSLITEKRLIFVGGQGEVGKTTLSAALSLLASRRGARVLVVSTDNSRNLGRAFAWEIGDQGAAVCAGVHALEIASDHQDDLFERLCTLIEDAEDYYDLVIVDAPPTDYQWRLLNASDTLEPRTEASERQKLFQRCRRRLQDRAHTGWLYVLKPEASYVLEAEQAIKGWQEANLSLEGLLVNGVLSKTTDGEFATQSHQQERSCLQDIERRFSTQPQFLLPLMPNAVHGIGALQQTAVLLDLAGL